MDRAQMPFPPRPPARAFLPVRPRFLLRPQMLTRATLPSSPEEQLPHIA
jgi:hypothetical protein